MDRHRLWTVIVVAYVGLASVAAAGLGLWWLLRDDSPATFEAERLEVNDRGAVFRVTEASGPGGGPLRWEDLDWSFDAEPLTDADGVVHAQEAFFVYTAMPGRLHVVSLSHHGDLLWTGAFAAEPEPEPEDEGLPLPPLPPLPVPPEGSDPLDLLGSRRF